ncbi:hypothetical protein BCR37DRAFT_383594 [Protomyces lactucae-debilis]|uniref:Uncharacterized protein n=1 Tax=Protomyces lactucae-debilis TaxID=2754530 RepID=A0A1Y2EX12_PROLT|nr:uncharacterized protein BCR37DRAFT_383594 [Protomyces lactucae-debilis]ORY76037.1 hypothetical protein BCR37DRAFT_383594 [Protomyces lactucae-debilis]
MEHRQAILELLAFNLLMHTPPPPFVLLTDMETTFAFYYIMAPGKVGLMEMPDHGSALAMFAVALDPPTGLTHLPLMQRVGLEAPDRRMQGGGGGTVDEEDVANMYEFYDELPKSRQQELDIQHGLASCFNVRPSLHKVECG